MIRTCWFADGTLLSQKAARDKSLLSCPHQTQTFTWPSWSAPLSHPLLDGGEFLVEECLDVGPDLVGFCPRERLEHTFTPGGENSRTPCVKGTVHPKIKLSNHHYIKNRSCVFPDLTCRTPRPAPSAFRRISAAVWPSLESHRPSGPEAPLWHHLIPAIHKD